MMENYDAKRQKLISKLKKVKESKKKMKRKLKMKIAQKHIIMKAKLQDQKELVRILEKKSGCKVSLELARERMTNENIHCVDHISSNKERDVESIQEQSSTEIPFDIQFFHSYAKPHSEKSIRFFYCSNCCFKTTKKNNLIKHEAAFCRIEPIRDVRCQICEKKFTYDALRGHLRHYATGKYKPKNKHMNHTPEQHKMLLEQLKQLKQKKSIDGDL